MEVNNNKGKEVFDQSIVTETPLGDKDEHLKIQICLEYRNVTTLANKKGRPRRTLQTPNVSKDMTKQLDVTILWLKNVPKQSNKANPTPYIKLRLLPDDILFTTELQEEKIEAKFYETFHFEGIESLASKYLHVQVCNKKVTRHAVAFGEVKILLDDLTIEKPKTQWYDVQ